MSSTVIDEVRSVIPPGAKLSGTGFYNFNCPACGDKRQRGGFAFTPSGGFRYRCFNGGCTFERATGYEPDNGFGGRPRKIFELLGGDVRRIPIQELLKWHRFIYNAKGEVTSRSADLEVVYKFPTVQLPDGVMPLLKAAENNKAAREVLKYVAEKDPANIRNFPYLWAPGKHSYYYIIPFRHYNDQVVGYVGRHIYMETGERRFIGTAPSDYMFNQHIISSYRARYLFVVESPMDAIALDCVATRGNRMTQKQVNLLKVSGKDIVLLPDYDEPWEFFKAAEENDWFISRPNFGSRKTDVMKSVARNGLLLTTTMVMDGIMKDYEQAKLKITLANKK